MKTNLPLIKQDLKKGSARIFYLMTVTMIIVYIMSLCGAPVAHMRDNEIYEIINEFCGKYYLDYLFSYLVLSFGYYLICGVVLRNNNNLALKWGLIIGAIWMINKIFINIPMLDMFVAVAVIIILSWRNKTFNKWTILLDIPTAFAAIIVAVLVSVDSKGLIWNNVRNDFILSLILSFDIFLWYGLLYLIIYLRSPNIKSTKPLIVSLYKYVAAQLKVRPNIHRLLINKYEWTYTIGAALYNIFMLFTILLVAHLYNIIGATIIATICYLINKNFYGRALRLRLNLLSMMLCLGTYYVIITTLNHIGAGTNLSVLIGSIIGMMTSYAASGKMYQYEPIVLLPKDMLKEKFKDKTLEEMKQIANSRGMKDYIGETVYYYLRMTAEQAAEKLQVQPRTVYRRVADFNKKEGTIK